MAGGDGRTEPATGEANAESEPIAHRETASNGTVGDPEPQRTSRPGALDRVHDLRVHKCRAIVQALYPDSGFLPYCEFFISEHERQGIAEEWQWSLAYGGANFSLRVGGIAPGNCAGPMDVKHRPLVTDPEANIAWHCREMAYYHKRGRHGYRLVKTVFLPRAPRDWGHRRILRTYRRHVQTITEAYRRGEL